MSHSDYFNYKPYGDSTEKPSSSKMRQSSSSSSSRLRSESLGRNSNTTQARVASSPISPGLHSTQYFRSPNAVYSPGESPLNTVQLFNRLPGIPQGQFFHQNAISGSSSSSARSSRRPSNIGLPLPKILSSLYRSCLLNLFLYIRKLRLVKQRARLSRSPLP